MRAGTTSLCDIKYYTFVQPLFMDPYYYRGVKIFIVTTLLLPNGKIHS